MLEYEYRVQSGDLDYIVKSTYKLHPFQAADRAIHAIVPQNLGELMEITGGHLIEPHYVLTTNLAGLWEQNDD